MAYRVELFCSEEDLAYVAAIPELEGCWASGETPNEALREIQIAKELWLEASRERGWPIPEPRYRST